MARYTDKRSLQAQIAADLRAKILAGDFPPGTKLPTNTALQEEYGVTGPTMLKVLDTLKAEGLLVGQRGMGVFVHADPMRIERVNRYAPSVKAGEPARVIVEGRRDGGQVKAAILDVGEVSAPLAVAEAFGLPPGSSVLRRHQLCSLDGDPMEVVSLFFRVDVARDTPLAARARIPGGVDRLLAALGHVRARQVDQISARPPTNEESELLEIPLETPVFRTFRTVFDGAGQAIQVEVEVKGAHAVVLEYELTLH